MKNLIGNTWCDSSDGKTVEVRNPATNQVIDTVPQITIEDVDRAVQEAKLAGKEWAKVPMHERGRILEKYVELVERDADKFAQLLCQETGKPITEAKAEIGNVRTFVYGYVERAKHLYGINIPTGSEPGQEYTVQYTIQQPLGVVACIIPFNFPIDLFGQKVPSALIMGNAVIVKPSTSNPLTIHMLVDYLIKAGVPYGVIQVISGSGEIVGQALASHKDVDLISLTGSTGAGMQTMETAAKHLGHVTLELGGNDAFILCEDGDIDLAVEETVWGRLYNTGQVCCASKRFLVHNRIKNEYITKMIEKIKTLKVGNPLDPETKIGCLISEQAAEEVEKQVRETVAAGAKIVYGGRRNGAFFEPTILTDVTKDMDVAKDMEIFGPVISIIGFDTIEEAIDIANASRFGLCGNVITRDMKTAFKVAEALECGGAVINGASFYRSAEMPFGGWKHSGIGNEGIATTLQEMSHTKTIVLKNVLQ